MEPGQQSRQVKAGRRDGPDDSHGDVAVDEPGERVDRIPDTSHGRQRGTGVGKHGSASLGDPYGPGRAVQQGLPEFSLQPADLRAHPGLCDVCSWRRPW